MADLDSEKRGERKTRLQQNQNAFKRRAFCYAARKAIAYSSTSWWQNEAKVAVVPNTNRLFLSTL